MKLTKDFFVILAAFCYFVFGLYLYFQPKTQARIKFEHEKVISRGQNLGNSMQYFKDDRTRKCFGLYHYVADGYKHYSVTEVECTPETEELIKKGIRD